MEKFKISVDGNEFEIRTPKLKGQGNIEFSVYQGNDLIFKLSPLLTKNNKLSWASPVNHTHGSISTKNMKAIGKAIEQHYLKTDM